MKILVSKEVEESNILKVESEKPKLASEWLTGAVAALSQALNCTSGLGTSDLPVTQTALTA